MSLLLLKSIAAVASVVAVVASAIATFSARPNMNLAEPNYPARHDYPQRVSNSSVKVREGLRKAERG